ncbi:MAG: AAA family ATPase, partial [Hyphomicrobiales bacterium]|nr:AAA family ATPase [Hyphomicrobiales bacterium]
ASIAELTFDTGAIDSQVEVLKSEKIALAVIDAMKLDQDPEFIGRRRTLLGQAFGLLRSAFDFGGWFRRQEKSVAEGQVAPQRAAIAQLNAHLDVRRVARTYVLAVTYTSPDPTKAAAIANAFANAYLKEQLDAKFEAASQTASWLQTRLERLKQDSLSADLAVQKFKAENGIVVTGGDRPALISDQRLTELNERMVVARTDTAKAEARYKQIDDLLKSGRVGAAVPDSLDNPVINDLRTEYLNAAKLAAQLETKLGGGDSQVISLRREMDGYERLIFTELQRIAESYRSEAEVARSIEQSLNVSMSGLVGASAQTNEALVQLRQLERESDSYRTLYQAFLERYQEAVQRQSFPVNEARIITAATAPLAPSYPKRGLLVALSLVLGAMAGSGLGALREYRDRVFRVASHVRDELDLEFLGTLRSIDVECFKTHRGDVPSSQIQAADSLQRYSIDHPLSAFSETLRRAKLAIDLALGDRKVKVVGVTSILPNEGKTTVAKNLASLLAHLGARTLLIDADLRNPGLTTSLARHAHAGVLEAIRADQPLDRLLLTEPESGLSILPAVVTDPVQHSSELVSSLGMRNLLAEAGKDFSYIIVDLPSSGAVVDVHAAASMFHAFIFVVEWGRTQRASVQSVLSSNSVMHDKCVGVLYNKVNPKRVDLYEL